MLAEYDALEGLGHACGHHLIAGISALAAIGTAALLRSARGTVHVIGCPAEETIGGKALLVRKGVFRGIDAAMMIHPADRTEIVKLSLSMQRIGVVFRGVSSHASATPWKGRSALAAMLSLMQAIDANRATMPEGDRIDGIVRRGGDAANIVPDLTGAEFFIRSRRMESHRRLLRRFMGMVKGAAKAFGVDYGIEHSGNVYYPLSPSRTLADLFAAQVRKYGITIDSLFTDSEMGSSDIGNVSSVVPTIHPTLAITDRPCPAHSKAFQEHAGTEQAYRSVKTGALLLASTAAEIYKDHSLLSDLKSNTIFNIVDNRQL